MPKKLDVDVDRLCRLYTTLESIDKVAAVARISRTTVKRRLKLAGVCFRGRKTIDKDRESKRCHQCEKVKSIDAFNKCRSRRDGRSATCRVCWAAYQAERTLLINFGMTSEAFQAMLAKQGGGCAICRTSFGMTRLGRQLRLAVDHCHRTSVVRGLLCSSCNNGLGRFKDDPELLLQAARYLQNQGG